MIGSANNKTPVGRAAAGSGQRTMSAPSSKNKSGKPVKKKPVNKPAEKKSALQPRTAGVSAAQAQMNPNRTVNKAPAKKSAPKKPLFGRKKPAAKRSAPKNNAAKPSVPQNNAAPSKARKNPARPVDKRSRKAADRAVRNKQAAVKRHRYHGGNYILYYILAGLVVITVLVILANTVLFKCKEIVVTGNSRYSAEEIIQSSGLALGDNLLHISRSKTAANVEAGLAYIDSAEVKKSFPTEIRISVAESERWFCVRQGTITAAVSRGGKIVEQAAFDDLPLIIGMEAETVEVGARLKSTIESKSDLPALILNAVDSVSLEKVDEIDITDRFSIKMRLDGGRITLELGTSSDMEGKLKVAKTIIETQIGDAESVTIIVTSPTMGAVHNNTSSSENDTSSSDDQTSFDNSTDNDSSGGGDNSNNS